MADTSLSIGEGQARDGVIAPLDPGAIPADEAGAAALKGQIARFGATGLANVGVDLSAYSALLFFGAPIPFAKGAAFICGTVFAYFANKNWTFRAGKGNARQFAAFVALYAFSMAVNVGVNSAVISVLGAGLIGKASAYVVALVLSASINFIGMRAILLRGGREASAAGA